MMMPLNVACVGISLGFGARLCAMNGSEICLRVCVCVRACVCVIGIADVPCCFIYFVKHPVQPALKQRYI